MRDIKRLTEAGAKKLEARERSQLKASDYIQLIEEASLNGSDRLLELINKVYALGYEEGYRASKYDTKKRRNNREVLSV